MFVPEADDLDAAIAIAACVHAARDGGGRQDPALGGLLVAMVRRFGSANPARPRTRGRPL
jgi:hypothetical protein